MAKAMTRSDDPKKEMPETRKVVPLVRTYTRAELEVLAAGHLWNGTDDKG